MYKGDFVFHPVGQGCFYTGELFYNDNSLFNFVYDCGTNSEQSYIKEAVSTWPVKDEGRKINVCMISHFHSDHTSGIPQLLKNTRCDRLIIPYYTPFQRLMIYLESGFDDIEYKKMMQDPYGYFSGENFDIGRIIVVRGGEGNTNVSERNPNTTSPSKSSNDNRAQHDYKNDDSQYEEFVQMGKINDIFSNNLEGEELSVTPKIVRVRHLPYQLKTPHYKFIFYTLSEEDGSSVELIAKTDALRTKVNSYYNAKRADPTSGVASFSDLFNEEHIKVISRIYGQIFGPSKINSTSLSVLHQITTESHDILIGCDFKFCTCKFWNHDGRYATLMTGDLELNTREKLNLFQNYYNSHLNEVGVFQVMHHGSDKNWPFGLAESQLSNFPNYVINHGVGRKHHPGTEVTRLLRGLRPHNVMLNNELNKLRYSMYWDF